MKTAWRLMRAHASYRRVLLAGLVSLTGDWVLHIGLAYLVYDRTRSTVASGATLLAGFVPQVALASVAGVLIDRWDRRRTMVAASLLQAVGLLPLLLVGPVWIVYAVAFWQGCVEQFFVPAEQSYVPLLVPPEDLLVANALNGQNRDVARLVGSSLGGVLAAWGGLRAVALADAGTFVAAAVLVAGARATFVAEAPARVAARLRHEWREGLRVIRGSRGLRTVLAFVLVVSVGEGVMGTLMAPWVRDVVHGDGRAYGLIMGMQAIGGVTGGLVAASVGARATPRAMFAWGAIAFGLLDCVLFTYPLLWPHVAPALVVMALVGLPGAVYVAGRVTVLQTLTMDRYRGRVFGAFGAVQAVSVLAGIGAASWLGGVVGILPVIVFQGVGYVAGGALALAGLRDQA